MHQHLFFADYRKPRLGMWRKENEVGSKSNPVRSWRKAGGKLPPARPLGHFMTAPAIKGLAEQNGGYLRLAISIRTAGRFSEHSGLPPRPLRASQSEADRAGCLRGTV